MINHNPRYRSYNMKYPTIACIRLAIRQDNFVGIVTLERMFDDVVKCVDDSKELIADRDDILRALGAGCPAIAGNGTIGSSIIGQILLVNVSTANGLIFGSGAIVLREGDVVPDGAVIMLRDGEVLRGMDDMMSHVLGVFEVAESINESDN